MTFPQTPLPIKVELQLGGTWTDITSDVRAEDQIRITRGRQDEGSTVEPTRCSFTLDNNSGKYTPGNPTGPYYGQIGRNTPCRVSVLTGSVYLDLTGSESDYAETADTAVLDVTGDLDVRLDASLANWLPAAGSSVSGTLELIGKFNGTTQKSWFLGARDGRLYVEWSADGTNSLSVSSTAAPVIPGSGRLAVRVTLDVNNGTGGNTVTFYTASTINGPWAQLGAPVTTAGVTSVFASTAPLRIGNATNYIFGAQPMGRVHAAEVRNGIGGTVVANPDFTAQASGTTSFTDSAGRLWTLAGSAAITNRKTRFAGEISGWPRRWATKFDVVVQTEGSGIMRRLTQGAAPVRSAIYREMTNPSRQGVVAYWPMEDGADATTFASALDGEQGMTLTPFGITPAAYSGWDASDAMPTFNTGRARGRVPAYTQTNYVFTRFFAAVPSGGVSSTQRLFSLSTSGTARTWTVYLNTTGTLDLRAYDSTGTQILATGATTDTINGVNAFCAVELTQSGADISYQLIMYFVDRCTLSTVVLGGWTGTLLGRTFGTATEVRVGQDGGMNGTALGHITVASGQSTFVNTLQAMIASKGEDAAARIHRLGMEEGITAYPVMAGDQTMGAQRLATLLDLMREAEAADGGILYEDRDRLGLRYRDRLSMLNQTPALTLNYSGADGLVTPLDPTDDDQQVRNDRTVARTGGSSARVTLDEGALSTQAPPDGVGRYDDSQTLNLFDDDRIDDIAGWLVHLGTWEATRYPTVTIMLANATQLIEAATLVDIGDRMRITNPPAWEPPDLGYIDLMVQGYTETIDQFTWTLVYNCNPAGAWDVAWTGDRTTASSAREFAWLDTAGCQLAEDLTSTETDLDLFTTTGPTWTDDVADLPLDIRVGGEVMTVTAPGSLVNSNPFFDTNVTGWSGLSASIAYSTAIVHPHPRARGSALVTPTGGIATASLSATVHSPVGSITPGGSYTCSYWVYSPLGWPDFRASIDWADAADAAISTTSGSAQVIPAGQWTYVTVTGVAPANASRAGARAQQGNTPAATDIWYAWGLRTVRAKASSVYDAFGRTAASSWGLADSGQTWTTSGGVSTNFNVGSGYGGHTLSTVNVSRYSTVPFTNADIDVYGDVTASAAATGASLYGALVARYADASNSYLVRVEFTTANAVILSIRKRVAAVETQLGTYTTTIAYTPGTYVRVRFQVIGSALKAKVWLATGVEPDVWRIEVTDTALTTSTAMGMRSISAVGNTNVNPEVRFDNVEIINPQTVIVTRSQNGVVKSHSAGADVRLATPAIISL